MPSELQRLKKIFITAITEELIPFGFKRKDVDFWRKTSYGSDWIHINIISHPGFNFEISPDVNVRHDAVEELMSRHNICAPDEYRSTSSTIGRRVLNMVPHLTSVDWTIMSEADIAPVIQSLMVVFHKVILPYIEKHSSLEEILTVMRSGAPGSPVPIGRAMEVAAIAYVLGMKDEFEHLVNEMFQLLRGIPNEYGRYELPLFSSLVQDIRGRWGIEAAPVWSPPCKLPTMIKVTCLADGLTNRGFVCKT